MATVKTVVSIFNHHPATIGGMEAFARELSEQLAALGWRSVFVFAGEAAPQVRRFLDSPHTVQEVVERCGMPAWRAVRQTARLLGRHRPSIVHLHFIDCRSGYPWLAKLLQAKRVFLTDHSSRPAGPAAAREPAWRRSVARLLHWPLDAMFCVSGFVCSGQRERGVLANGRLAVLYNGVDLRRAEAGLDHGAAFRARYSIPPDRIVVAQASWLIPEKGVEDLLRAAALVVPRDDRIHFLIAGQGPAANDLARLAEELRITDHVTFTGRIADPLGEGLYAATDIVCQVSRWQEAFGMTIAEAMASHRPVIGTRVGGIPELIEHDVTGFLIQPGDCHDLADGILLLARDAERRKMMGESGRRVCEQKFDLRQNVATLIQRYGIT